MVSSWRRLGAVCVAAAAFTGVLAHGPTAAAAPVCLPFVVKIEDKAGYEGTGNLAETTVSFTVSGTGCPNQPASVAYAVLPGTAAVADFVPRSGRLSWGIGDSSDRTVTVTVVRDQAEENAEWFAVRLSDPRGPVTIADGDGVGTIDDDDGRHDLVSSISGGTISWVPDPFWFTVDLRSVSGWPVPARHPVEVGWRTVDGTARHGVDFELVSDGVAVVSVGRSSARAMVRLLPDEVPEADEYFFVELTWSSAGTVRTGRVRVTIRSHG